MLVTSYCEAISMAITSFRGLSVCMANKDLLNMQGKQFSPNIKWAQRKEAVFIIVDVRDLKNESIKVTSTSLTFDGDSDNKHYHFELEFFEEINAEESKWTKTGFNTKFNIVKKSQNPTWWPRLSKDTKKNGYITHDWDKYIEEDEEKEEGQKGMGDWDPSMMQAMGGMGGMGGMPGMGGMGGMPGMGGMGGFPGMGGMGGMPGMGGMGGMSGFPGMGGFGDDEGEDEEEAPEGDLDHGHDHKHDDNCNHEEEQAKKEAPK